MCCMEILLNIEYVFLCIAQKHILRTKDICVFWKLGF